MQEFKNQSGSKALVAHRVHVVCDQGHYGFTVCSNCNKDAGSGDQCQNCGAAFTGKTEVAPGFGGSDF